MSVLEEILASTRADLERRRAAVPLEALERAGADPAGLAGELGIDVAAAGGEELPRRPPHAFRDALARPGLSVIAEHKRRSPSAGPIRPGSSVVEVARAYEAGGAAAISVLTEERNFDGSLEDLSLAARACSLPLLRKDFIVDPYQLYEARAAGASAVLLIVAALDSDALASLHAHAVGLELDVLVEVHDAEELAAAAAVGATLIGVNNRDLRDFTVDRHRTHDLLASMPAGAIVVSESGISTADDLIELDAAGVDAVLIGERLMRSEDPAQALRKLLQAVAST